MKHPMSTLISCLRRELKLLADEKTRQSSDHFFKEPVKHYGIKTATVSRLGKETFKTLPDKSKTVVYKFCEELWQSGYMEEAFIACQWSYACKNQFEPSDFTLFEKWVNTYVSNWAACDTFCNHTLGEFLHRYPQFVTTLKAWTHSPNRWLRRGAAVSLIIPAREGDFLSQVFEIADLLLLDKDDLVQKGYGWMLKAASAKHAGEVLDYVIGRKATMPRTALRYAIEKLTPAQKARAMAK
jgi:3-methyladenine DNA glycosylase AlkD